MSEKLSVKKRIVKISNMIRLDKDGKNTFSNYDYFKPDDILKNLNPLLDEFNLITTFNLRNHPTMENYYVAQLIIEDCESNDKVEFFIDIEKAEVKGANKAQNSGATLTYAKRYSLMNAFNLAVNDDDFDAKKSKPSNPTPKQSKPVEDRVNSMLDIFKKELAVSKEQIEKYIGKKISAFIDADINKLSTVYSDIKSNKKNKDEVFK